MELLQRLLCKTSHDFLWGTPDPYEGFLENNMTKHEQNQESRVDCGTDGEPNQTKVQVLRTNSGSSTVQTSSRANPKTVMRLGWDTQAPLREITPPPPTT